MIGRPLDRKNMKMTGSAPAIDKLSFESALTELEKIVRDVEQGKAGLEDSIAAYERGMQLKQHCQQRLDAAQMRIAQIVAREGQPPTLTAAATES
jgi:exodeoxyribonuclease VII small subunit